MFSNMEVDPCSVFLHLLAFLLYAVCIFQTVDIRIEGFIRKGAVADAADFLHNLVSVHGFLFQKEQNQHFAQAVLQAFGEAVFSSSYFDFPAHNALPAVRTVGAQSLASGNWQINMLANINIILRAVLKVNSL